MRPLRWVWEAWCGWWSDATEDMPPLMRPLMLLVPLASALAVAAVLTVFWPVILMLVAGVVLYGVWRLVAAGPRRATEWSLRRRQR